MLTPCRDSTAAVALTLIALTEAGRDELELAQDPVILPYTDFFQSIWNKGKLKFIKISY